MTEPLISGKGSAVAGRDLNARIVELFNQYKGGRGVYMAIASQLYAEGYTRTVRGKPLTVQMVRQIAHRLRLENPIARRRVVELPRSFVTPLKDHQRPQCRAHCSQVPRPCPFVGCRHHLYLDVKANGKIVLNHPDLEPWELADSCALDVAEQAPATETRGPFEVWGTKLSTVGRALGVTKERVRQVEARAMEKLRTAITRMEDRTLAEFLLV